MESLLRLRLLELVELGLELLDLLLLLLYELTLLENVDVENIHAAEQKRRQRGFIFDLFEFSADKTVKLVYWNLRVSGKNLMRRWYICTR